ncbi:translation initiation factor [Buchnera aphidicola (Nipponaphis monzeni)]|uniref:Translation initiation factor IF-3 n=2 Tax=Buchnera aphidicola TaxID=9 RepID=A0A455T9Y1_9GAMM|nr:translation initiation factor [Buchnera aphidicola (Nipponaphis monzeni)]
MKFTRPNRINGEIRATEVRLTGIQNDPIGIVSLDKALNLAKSIGVDLVEISPNARPPVCQIMDYGKFLYKKSKSHKKQKKNQKNIQIKEIKFRPGTEESDYQVKVRNITKFLIEGHKVKITLRFRGREMAHQEIGVHLLHRIKNELKNLSTIEFFPSKIESRQMIMILGPKKNKIKN